MLTDTKLRKSLGKRREAVEVLSDAHGLNVRLSVAGAVTFFYRYRWNGKPAQITIGEYPTVSLSEARDRRQLFRKWLTEDLDPRQQIKLEKKNKTEAFTVDEAYRYWEEYYCRPEGIVALPNNRKSYERHIKPVLGDALVDQTTKGNWITAFDAMGRTVMSGEMLSIMKRAFRFCSNRGVISNNPLENVRRSDVGTSPAYKDRKLSDSEIKTIWEELETLSIEKKIMIKFLLLTGCRSGEIRKARWSWFDFKEKTWTVPAEEYKTGKTVRRALGDATSSMLSALYEISSSELVLTKVKTRSTVPEPLNQTQVSVYSHYISNRTGIAPWTPHDMRRTVATRLSELGAPPHVIEKLLGHQMGGVMARYNLHDYLDDQRHWLKVWHDHLEKVIGRPLTKS
ncbi:tyrosine-type recombinase/integrase [Pantoea piersonii]|uniref:tyrosine-type recombinase/integrase n=1 Tax=Pantoea piersonii TaxID=2364647 RepID=UPI00289D0F3F|nr:tyrosine-type recombinase/integrase [Pantoea piersonii]